MEDKVAIVHKVLIGFELLKDVAKEYHVSQTVVSLLVKKVKTNPNYFRELLARQDEWSSKLDRARSVIEDMVSKNEFIDSAAQVQKLILNKTTLDLKEYRVRKILTFDFGMSYKKIKSVALHANSDKNRILRQRFAIELVNLLNAGKRIINVDESWLGMTDFRRQKWCPKG